jgi:WD40 repeat protein
MTNHRSVGIISARKLLVVLSAGLLFLAWFVVCSKFLPARPRITFLPAEECNVLLFSPDGKSLTTAGFAKLWFHKGPLQVWDAESGRQLLSVAESWDRIRTIDFSPDGMLLAARQENGELKVWDIHAGKEVLSLEAVASGKSSPHFRYSPDGKVLVVQDRGSKGDSVKFWDLTTKQERASIKAAFRELEFTSGGDDFITSQRGDDRSIVKVRRWRLGDSKDLLIPLGQHDLSVDTLALSPDGTRLATANHPSEGGEPPEVELRDLESGIVRLRFPLEGDDRRIQHLSFSPDGRFLVAHIFTHLSSPVLRIENSFWDVSQEKATKLGTGPLAPAFSLNGKSLALPTENGAELYDTTSMTKLATLYQCIAPGGTGICLRGS